MIRVLVVEDSPVVRELLVHILSSDPAMQVVGTATNGEEALEAVERVKPDIVTMDIHMPGMNGLDATRRIMETHPLPIVMVSASYEPQEVSSTFRALEAGALAIVPKPPGAGHPNYSDACTELLGAVKAMAEVKVVRRWARSSHSPIVPSARPLAESILAPATAEREITPSPVEIKVIAIGASTGGPMALQTILAELPADFRVPVLVVQHIAPGFIRGLGEWLGRSCKLSIDIARYGEKLAPGRIYLAPDGFQMQVVFPGRIALTADEPENGLRPSVSHLFRSVANVYGRQAIGVLLTGMGKDGAEELRLMKEKGAVTIAQDEASSVVHGMPAEAIRLGGATYILSPSRIASAITVLAHPAPAEHRKR